ncbi:MAG: methyltransferase [Micrococcaceae bacterium]
MHDNIDLLLARQNSKGKIIAIDDEYNYLKSKLNIKTFNDSKLTNSDSEIVETLSNASTVLLRMPKSIDRLAEYAELIAQNCNPEVTLHACGKDKYMNRNFNKVLENHFDIVTASLGWKKCRVISATKVKDQVISTFPKIILNKELDLQVVSHGGVFAGTKYDIGTRTFIDTLKDIIFTGLGADLGSGNGLVSAFLLKNNPQLKIEASDDSYFAYLSTKETLKLNGLTAKVSYEHSLSNIPNNYYDYIFLNPPFHAGTKVIPTVGIELITNAKQKLKTGGTLYCVYNSMLNRYYLPEFKKFNGKVTHLTQNRKFIVKSVTKS